MRRVVTEGDKKKIQNQASNNDTRLLVILKIGCMSRLRVLHFRGEKIFIEN